MMTHLENNNNDQEQPVPGTEGFLFTIVWCYGYNHYGHYASHFPNAH